ncbi:nickel pincer cofactor biosynthesis protein LarC [bacterium]|nr:nickel pincer cofactor biosynthesis protein LarC [bacterium]MBU1651865.1 nickel pincer cofactor biosynthesis protein LarC [bacterium]MBU1882535.1 nickel pincer cofactor biosynthesis protein LarC [bacterium]
MKSIYLDCYSGVSGDMLLAALLDAGLDHQVWKDALKGMAVAGYDINISKIRKHAFTVLKLDVTVTEEQPHRHLKDIYQIIDNSALSDQVKENARRTFNLLAQAEAQVHDSTPEKIHFHEVGAVDAIVDIVGTCIALEMLDVQKIYATPVGVGKGLSKSAHGPMPLPPPATLQILENCPLHFHDVETELATPTGSAILKALASFTPPPVEHRLLKVGYGAGTKDIPSLPNFVRALLLEEHQEFETDSALLLETNIDDMNPEIYPVVISRLLQAGAMDVYLNPVLMKKGRPGIVLSALCSLELKQTIVAAIYRETSTLGIRISQVERLKLPRRAVDIETPLGRIRGKQTTFQGKTRISPEFEDCRRIADEKDLPLQDVYSVFYQAISHPDK